MTDSSGIKIEVVNTFSALLADKDKWDDLLGSSEADYVYMTLEWIEVYCRTFQNDSAFFCLIAVDIQENRWLGALPISIRKSGLTDLHTRFMAQAGGELADYLSPVIRRGREQEVIPLLFDRIEDMASGAVLLSFKNIPEQNITNGIIEEELRKRGWAWHKDEYVCPVLYMEGLEYDEIQKGWKGSHRGDVRRQKRRLSEMGRLELRFFRTPEETAEHFSRFMPMCEKRWNSIGYPDPMIKNRGREYYSNLVNGLGNSFLHFSALCLDERPISYHIGFLYNKWFYYYKPTHDIEYEKYSPGKVHIAYLIEHGCTEGWSAFDFLRGDEPYKFSWTPDVVKLSSFTISTSGAGLRYKWHAGGKTRAYELVGGLYRKIRLAGQRAGKMITK